MPSTSLATVAVVTLLAALSGCQSMPPRVGTISTDVPAAPDRAGDT
jgi:hypothetical protein